MKLLESSMRHASGSDQDGSREDERKWSASLQPMAGVRKQINKDKTILRSLSFGASKHQSTNNTQEWISYRNILALWASLWCPKESRC